ncbi:helix-turn-helix domain-containing protein [Moritella sp.]|uniref:helix-turn-helix domain-containing protein n=1 Tax=Moritella sp. TaxID=78556 RepID=UPI001D29B35F|nr:helix-turn-helix domain-containing protein [Moritella sp.]
MNIIKNVIDKRISGIDAAALLNLSPRQVYRLTKQYLKHGTEGLISHRRASPVTITILINSSNMF